MREPVVSEFDKKREPVPKISKPIAGHFPKPCSKQRTAVNQRHLFLTSQAVLNVGFQIRTLVGHENLIFNCTNLYI